MGNKTKRKSVKTFVFSLVVFCAILGASELRSQLPGSGKTPQQELQLLKTQNQKLIEQQGAALQKLEELQKNVQQLRILARRT